MAFFISVLPMGLAKKEILDLCLGKPEKVFIWKLNIKLGFISNLRKMFIEDNWDCRWIGNSGTINIETLREIIRNLSTYFWCCNSWIQNKDCDSLFCFALILQAAGFCSLYIPCETCFYFRFFCIYEFFSKWFFNRNGFLQGRSNLVFCLYIYFTLLYLLYFTLINFFKWSMCIQIWWISNCFKKRINENINILLIKL